MWNPLDVRRDTQEGEIAHSTLGDLIPVHLSDDNRRRRNGDVGQDPFLLGAHLIEQSVHRLIQYGDPCGTRHLRNANEKAAYHTFRLIDGSQQGFSWKLALQSLR